MSNKILLTLFVVYSSLFVSVPSIFAEEPAPTSYTLLAPIPLEGCTGDSGVECQTTTAKFLPGLFKLMIAIATGLAVIMLIYAGVKYISTDAFSGKDEAKGIIEDALWGLLLAMSAWLILNTINPNLVNFDLRIDRLPTPVNTNLGTGGGGSTGGLQPSATNAVAGLRTACSNCSIRITSTTGDSHDPNSAHYKGLAVDIGTDANLTKFLTGQTTNPRACSTYLKTLNGVNSRFLWEPTGSTCGGAVASTGDHWHMSVTP